MAPDGSMPTRLTNTAEHDSDPAWSPDGSRIAFTRYQDLRGLFDIYTMAVDGSVLARVTNNASFSQSAAWSPDGTRIAFENWRGSEDGYEIYTIAPDGSAQTRVTRNAGDDVDVDWQPAVRPLVPPPAPALSPSGGGTPPPPPPARRNGSVERPLILSKLGLTRRAFCVGRRCPRSRRGTLLRFALSAAARVEFALQQRVSARRTGNGCRRATRQNRRGRRCSYYANAGSFSRAATAGVNRVAFTGQFAGRALPRGSYRLSLTAIGAGGARSTTQRVDFTVSRPPRAPRER
jgi:hypothetical protein